MRECTEQLPLFCRHDCVYERRMTVGVGCCTSVREVMEIEVDNASLCAEPHKKWVLDLHLEATLHDTSGRQLDQQ
jgi:hypothetical protein